MNKDYKIEFNREDIVNRLNYLLGEIDKNNYNIYYGSVKDDYIIKIVNYLELLKWELELEKI